LYLISIIDNTDDWQKLLEECLSHEVSAVKLKAAEAHTNFFLEYYVDIDYDARSAVVNRYLESLQSSNQSIRIGFAQAIGKLKVHSKSISNILQVYFHLFHFLQDISHCS